MLFIIIVAILGFIWWSDRPKNNHATGTGRKESSCLHARTSRTANCWSCQRHLVSYSHTKCLHCGWMICGCGSCGCGYKKVAATNTTNTYTYHTSQDNREDEMLDDIHREGQYSVWDEYDEDGVPYEDYPDYHDRKNDFL